MNGTRAIWKTIYPSELKYRRKMENSSSLFFNVPHLWCVTKCLLSRYSNENTISSDLTWAHVQFGFRGPQLKNPDGYINFRSWVARISLPGTKVPGVSSTIFAVTKMVLFVEFIGCPIKYIRSQACPELIPGFISIWTLTKFLNIQRSGTGTVWWKQHGIFMECRSYSIFSSRKY